MPISCVPAASFGLTPKRTLRRFQTGNLGLRYTAKKCNDGGMNYDLTIKMSYGVPGKRRQIGKLNQFYAGRAISM